MGTVIALILAIVKAIPSLKSAWDQALAAYIQNELNKMHHADKEAIRKAVYEQDQRDLERQLFNIDPGKRSDAPNTVIRDGLPNVLPGPKKR